MPNRKGVSHNDKNFNRKSFNGELYKPAGRPRPREIKSQEAQLESTHDHGGRRDHKLKMEEKTD